VVGRSNVRVYSGVTNGFCWWFGTSTSQFFASSGMKMWGASSDAQCWLAGYGAGLPAVEAGDGTSYKIHVEGDCLYAVDIMEGARVYFHSACTCSATRTVKSGIRIGGGGYAVFHDAPGGFLGATAGQRAYIMQRNIGVKADAWPNPAPALVTDTYGAQLIRTA
jgi:hypothetical protein